MTSFDPAPLEQRISEAMRSDQYRLRRELKRLSDRLDKKRLGHFQSRLAESVALCLERAQSIPAMEYPADLPVSEHRSRIVEMIRLHQAIIVCGETGSGKSTQLPKMCLDAGLGRSGMIGHTQPRRIAARSIATRVATEIGSRVGELVGFKIRFTDQTSPRSLIKLMTDGILLAESQTDRFLDQYDAIILDEAHERSLNIDFLLGIFRRLLQKRRDLRLIITSATIDAERFAEHFADENGPAPIINVEGRGYPVQIQYLPAADVTGDRNDEPSLGLAQHVAAGVDAALVHGQGDMLVFLPTERDIREVARHLGGHLRRGNLDRRTDILPLYARLPASEQQKIFAKSNKQKIVLATNVAESSLTVPGIRYVIDSGTARISRYSPRSKVQRLPIEPVSRASADQRTGRCGRVGPGVSIRLYDAEDYKSRDAFTTPEIRRTNLASVILQTKLLRLGSIEEFPFLDAPRPESIREGYRTLYEIGAIDDRNQLTPLGRTLGAMPVDPRVGRMIVEARERNCLPEVLVIAAALELQDARLRPPERQQAADAAHERFVDGRSDFLSYLRLWRFYRCLQEDLSRGRLAKACQKNFLGLNRLREWADIHRQLKSIASDLGRKKNLRGRGVGSEAKGLTKLRIHDATQPDQLTVDEDLYAAIHQSLLTGLLSGVAMAGDGYEYTGIGGQQFFLWPGSGVFQTKPKWIVAGELLETTRRYARNVARIDPGWLEPLANHLVRRNFSDPFWSRKSQAAFCYERVTLFGLPIVARRRHPLAPVDREAARRMLIEHGLVAGELVSRAKFYIHNQRLREMIAGLAHKTRRRDLMVDNYAIEHFYHARLPADVIDRATLEKLDRTISPPAWAADCRTQADLVAWLEKPSDQRTDGQSLYLSPSDLLPQLVESLDEGAFPDHLDIGPTRLPLSYHFDPSAADDGVTITIPLAALGQVSEDRLGWLVPGMLETKIVAMIKALPKRIRRNLVPAAETADRVIEALGDRVGKTPFMPTICKQLSDIAEMPIEPTDFDPTKLADSFGFFVRITDDNGQTISEGRDIQTLRGKLTTSEDSSPHSPAEISDDELHLDGLTDFSIEHLPEQVKRERGGVQVALYPAMIDQGESVSIRLLDNPQIAAEKTRRGIIRLFALAERSEIKKQVRWLPGIDEASVRLSRVVREGSFTAGVADLIANLAFVDGQPPVRSRDVFIERRKNRGERIATATQEIARLIGPLAERYHESRLMLEQCSAAQFVYVREDIEQQLNQLFHADFWIDTSLEVLRQYPRYLKAIVMRLEKLSSAAQRDREVYEVIAAFQRDYQQRIESASGEHPLLSEYRWMIEEFRVSQFAQTLGTSMKVSPQRLEKLRSKLDSARY